MTDDRREQNETTETPETPEDEPDEALHYIEDLEERKNASGPATTMAVGEEDGGGGW